MTSVVCAEGELLAAAKRIRKYIEFLQDSIVEYSCLVSTVDGIQDQKITHQLRRLAAEVSKQNQALSELNNMISVTITQHVSSIEESDSFRYPSIGAEGIRALLSNFL